jgi:hypothetical protein
MQITVIKDGKCDECGNEENNMKLWVFEQFKQRLQLQLCETCLSEDERDFETYDLEMHDEDLESNKRF